MTRNRLEEEEQRQQARDEAYWKRLDKALQKLGRASKPQRMKMISRRKGINARWKVIMKELVDTTVYIVD